MQGGLLALALILVSSVQAGCDHSTSALSPRSSDVRRIVSILPSNTEILYALGLGDRIVGVSRFDDYPPEVVSKEKVGDYFHPTVEKIVALRPDLVLTQASAQGADLEKALGRHGILVVGIANDSLEQMIDSFVRIADAAGVRERGEALAGETRERLEATRRRYAGRPRVKVLFILDTHPLYVVGRASYLNDLIEAAGGENVAAKLRGAYPLLSAEAIWEMDPDVILSGATAADAQGFFEPLRRLRAVASGRVRRVDATVVMRPGPRVFEALEEIARQLHDEREAR